MFFEKIYEKFSILLSFFAGLIMLIIGIITRPEPGNLIIRLLITLAAFYILGGIIKLYLDIKVFPKQPEEDKEQDDNEHSEHDDIEEISIEENKNADDI
ncbi:MAG: hypothetical protein FWD01_00030 [Defluviitaleaceae bacterium]|nr:hypothetical protein [Defluviitaleaceae bacterium]